VISPFLPIIEDELVISHGVAGSIFSYVSAGYTVSLFLSGLVSSRIGYKRSIGLGFAILAISFFCLKFANGYGLIAVVAFFIGLGAGTYLPSSIPLLTSIFRRESWGKAIALHQTGAPFGFFSMPILAAVALGFFPWRTFFMLFSGACLIALLFIIAFAPNPSFEEKGGVGFSWLLRRRDFWIMAIFWILASAAFAGLYNVIPLFLVKERGMQLETANTIFGFSRVGGFFINITAGFLIDHYGAKRILFIVLFITGLFTLGVALAHNLIFLMTMLIFQATFSPGFFPIGLVTISKLTESNERSLFTGATIAVGTLVGAGLTPAVLGVVADVVNFQIGILFLGVLVMASCSLVRGIADV
jgi:NNP family nitrate/nitrite transporter-like MFS transporter